MASLDNYTVFELAAYRDALEDVLKVANDPPPPPFHEKFLYAYRFGAVEGFCQSQLREISDLLAPASPSAPTHPDILKQREEIAAIVERQRKARQDYQELRSRADKQIETSLQKIVDQKTRPLPRKPSFFSRFYRRLRG